MHTRRRLADDLRALGVGAGDVVMVHASVRAVGEVAGGPDQIHLALKDALTDDGTLLMYASCPRYVDEVGRGNLTPADEAELLEKLPPFDPHTARAARENGALVELLRTWPGSRVNDHVARFVAWGKHAGHLLSETPWDYAFGYDSPLDRFVALEGRILLLGANHDTVTFLHHAEHIVEIPDKRVARFKVPVLRDGARQWLDMEEYDTSRGAHANFPDDFFSRIVDAYMRNASNAGGRVGDADSCLLPARELLAYALPVMQRVAADRKALTALMPADRRG